MAYGNDDFNYGVRMRKYRVKRREILMDAGGVYRCPHCTEVLLRSTIREPLFYDDTIEFIIGKCGTVDTSTKGRHSVIRPKDNMTECLHCRKPAFSYGHTLGKETKKQYQLDDELFEL